MSGLLIIYVENPNMTSKTQPVIFLDFDGVIRYKGWSREALDNLEALCYQTGARVVISSDWRHSHSLPELKQLLWDLNFHYNTGMDVTPILANYEGEFAFYEPRNSEIEAYIRDHDVKNYVVLDDIFALGKTALAPRLVLCEYETGFTEERLALARKILSKNNE